MRVKVKRSGSVFIGVTVFLGVAAANTGNNLLYMVVSALLSVMLVSGVSSLLNLIGVEVVIIPPPKVFARREAVFRVVLRKKLPLPSFLVRVSSGKDTCLFTFVGKKPREGRLGFLFEKRGYVEKLKVILSSDFPLGMFVRSYEPEVKVDLVVFPEPVPASFPRLEAEGKIGGREDLSHLSTKGFDEVKDIKEYAGEPMKLIHWKVTAKRGELMVKETVSSAKEPVILSLDSVEGDLETKLSKLTFLALKLSEEGYPVGLKLRDKEIPPATGEEHLLKILRELATY